MYDKFALDAQSVSLWPHCSGTCVIHSTDQAVRVSASAHDFLLMKLGATLQESCITPNADDDSARRRHR
jgi:hypothetical protein